jgi:hypothetical protein
MAKKRSDKKSTKKKNQGSKSVKKKKANPKGGTRKAKARKKKSKIGFASHNFSKIRTYLWRKHKADYKGSDYLLKDGIFLATVKDVYYECKVYGRECDEKDYENIYQDLLKHPTRPLVDRTLFYPNPYYEISAINWKAFATAAPTLWVISPMIMSYPSKFMLVNYVNKGIWKSYNRWFKEWVDWCNDAMSAYFGASFDSKDIEIFFRFTVPKYNETKKRWETEILSCTPDGVIEDFGFIPLGKGAEHLEEEFKPYYEEPKKGKKKVVKKGRRKKLTKEERMVKRAVARRESFIAGEKSTEERRVIKNKLKKMRRVELALLEYKEKHKRSKKKLAIIEKELKIIRAKITEQINLL